MRGLFGRVEVDCIVDEPHPVFLDRVENERGGLLAGIRIDLNEHRRLAEAFAAFAAPLELPESVSNPLEIAFDEILTNICRYAWNDDAWHPIEVLATCDDDRISVTFSDDGVAFDPLATAPEGLDGELAERPVGGLGIHLVRELMDDVHYRRDEPFNRLTIQKRIRENTPADRGAGDE